MYPFIYLFVLNADKIEEMARVLKLQEYKLFCILKQLNTG